MADDRVAVDRTWQLHRPRDRRGQYRVTTPDGRVVVLKCVPTWTQYEREIATLVRWTNDADIKSRAMARFRDNPWAYGYHVLEDETTTR